MPALTISSVVTTECFVGTREHPSQVLRVTVDRDLAEAGVIEVVGDRVHGHVDLPPGSGPVVVEVPLGIDSTTTPGESLAVVVEARAAAGDGLPTTRRTAEVVVAEPGWTMYLVSHFHYDPVWWNTQAAYTQVWELQADDGLTRPVWRNNGFDLVRAHLAMAARDPDYTFVLAEVDYLKPFWDTFPEARTQLRELIAAGRVEIMGGTYNEPNTNLTSAETTIRNFVYGMGYQREILGADPRTAWQLDAFGHDPQFPGLAADAGLTSSSWARGPHHQWGPVLSTFKEVGGDVRNMQFPAEFEWLSPSGEGVLTHYMPNHYSAGWWMDSSTDLEEAEQKVYELYLGLKPAASTKNLLLPVGTDYTPPNKWVTAIHRDWNDRYVWPRFICGNPRDFFAAVEAELGERGVRPSPQSRDMNPLYTGKDVSFIDTKQAQRAGEIAAVDAEKLATLAAAFGLGEFPDRAMDKVWRQLAYGAHHDAITGSESDQVYIDLLSGWREAYDLATDVRDRSLHALLGQVDSSAATRPIAVVNTLSFRRTDLVRVQVDLPAAGEDAISVCDDTGRVVPHVITGRDGSRLQLTFVADDVPGTGWRLWHLTESAGTAPSGSTWQSSEAPAAVGGLEIANEHYRVRSRPESGGGLDSIIELAGGRELVRAGLVANELRVYDEYPAHPEFGEGPWHLVPTGAVVSSAERAARSVRREVCGLGERLIVSGTVGGVRYEQHITLWHGLDRIDFRTRLDHDGSDVLVRVRFPCPIAGARPVSEVAGAVISRGFAFPDVDAAEAPWTLDNPANNFVALSTTTRLRIQGPDGTDRGAQAIAVAEIIVPDHELAAPLARDLVRALARAGVTATTSAASGARYGWLDVDSNLPDIRIVLGGADTNSFAAEVIRSTEARHREHLETSIREGGAVRLLVPGLTSVEDAWVPQADIRGPRAIPAIIVAAADETGLDREIAEMAAELAAEAAMSVRCLDDIPPLDDHTVGLLTYGIPGFAVDTSGALHLSLMRSCTGWPSGVWLDPPVRRAPDGSAFQLQHWTHDFDYSLVSGHGDWRARDLVSRGLEHSTPLHARAIESRAGHWPSTYSLLDVDPEREVHLQALKPTGNPCATGAEVAGGSRRGLTMRLSETRGRDVEATVSSPIGFSSADRSDILEQRHGDSAYDAGRVRTQLSGARMVTIVATPEAPAPYDASMSALGAIHELAQPVYARYWLHNRGPAPMGFLPISVATTPAAVRLAAAADDAADSEVEVSIASQLTQEDVVATLAVVAPEGWTCEPASRPVWLPPGGHTTFPLRVSAPARSAPGLYFVRVQLPLPAGDVVEDVVTVIVPGAPCDAVLPAPPAGPEVPHEQQMLGTTAGTARAVGLEIQAHVTSINARPGECAALRFRLTNQARSAIDGELMLVSPWGTWELTDTATFAFSVGAEGEAELSIPLQVPIDATPGRSWLLAKFMWFGRIHYSAVIALEVATP